MAADLGQIIWEYLTNSANANVLATLLAGGIGALAVLVAAAISHRVLMKQIEISKEQHYDREMGDHYRHLDEMDHSYKQRELVGLLEAFRLLDSPEHRKSRKKVFEKYFEFLKERNPNVFTGVTEIGDVMADFDVIGKLVEKENISRDDFLNVYGSLVYRCWRLLEVHIEQERKSREFPKFMSNFERLAIEGYHYWLGTEHYDINNTVLYNPNPNAEATRKDITFKEIVKENESYLAKSI
jgi:hypothetical protein